MAHESATLTSDCTGLGKSGDVINIDAVEKLFKTSSAANAAANFRCHGCKVKVHAVITVQSKTGRKSSPASYFSSSPRAHDKDCTRLQTTPPRPVTAAASEGITAAPKKGKFPTAWRKHRAERSMGAKDGNSDNLTEIHDRPKSGGVSVSPRGSRTSSRSTELVSILVYRWEDPDANHEVDALNAPWNPEGLYSTAFVPVGEGFERTDIRIYFCAIKNVRAVRTGIVIELSATHADGAPLLIWVRDTAKTRPGADKFWEMANHPENFAGKTVYALGKFLPQEGKNQRWHSLPIDDMDDFCIT